MHLLLFALQVYTRSGMSKEAFLKASKDKAGSYEEVLARQPR